MKTFFVKFGQAENETCHVKADDYSIENDDQLVFEDEKGDECARFKSFIFVMDSKCQN